ncbi:MAG: hypothetical protein ACRDPY_24945 [Streptosporangiaceae bacterium]
MPGPYPPTARWLRGMRCPIQELPEHTDSGWRAELRSAFEPHRVIASAVTAEPVAAA